MNKNEVHIGGGESAIKHGVTVETTVTISLERIRDLIINDREGGYTDFVLEDRHEPTEYLVEPRMEKGLERYDFPINPGGYWIMRDRYEDEDKDYKFDLDSIKKGISIMANKFPRHFADVMTGDDDAITAGVFMQCCLLGDVIYG